ncbi:MAG: heavy metal-associated domain-containing protein [Acidobacteriaceae bacterium]
MGRKRTSRILMVFTLLVACRPLPAEYLQIHLKVYGLDCELCARGVGASVHRMTGVKSVEVSLKTGMIGIQLIPGNTLKMSDLRKRIQDNGFRPMEARVTALGRLNGSKFEVLGTGESYDVPGPAKDAANPAELTFDIP